VNRLAEILEDKGRVVLSIDAEASVFDAVQLMVEMNVGSLLVTEDAISGIVTKRDYLRRVTLEGRTETETAARSRVSEPRCTRSTSTTTRAASGTRRSSTITCPRRWTCRR
jgi:signal-transduction protein with cAMP-binding, CBS, and nucleotidyltransferase domain